MKPLQLHGFHLLTKTGEFFILSLIIYYSRAHIIINFNVAFYKQ